MSSRHPPKANKNCSPPKNSSRGRLARKGSAPRGSRLDPQFPTAIFILIGERMAIFRSKQCPPARPLRAAGFCLLRGSCEREEHTHRARGWRPPFSPRSRSCGWNEGRPPRVPPTPRVGEGARPGEEAQAAPRVLEVPPGNLGRSGAQG